MFRLLTERFGRHAHAHEVEDFYFSFLCSVYLPEHNYFDHAWLNMDMFNEGKSTLERFSKTEAAITGFASRTVFSRHLERNKKIWRVVLPEPLEKKLKSAIKRRFSYKDTEFQGNDIGSAFGLESRILDSLIFSFGKMDQDLFTDLLYTRSAALMKKKQMNDHERWHELLLLARKTAGEWKAEKEMKAQARIDSERFLKLRREVYFNDIQIVGTWPPQKDS